jgi:myosin heavy subunit
MPNCSLERRALFTSESHLFSVLLHRSVSGPCYEFSYMAINLAYMQDESNIADRDQQSDETFGQEQDRSREMEQLRLLVAEKTALADGKTAELEKVLVQVQETSREMGQLRFLLAEKTALAAEKTLELEQVLVQGQEMSRKMGQLRLLAAEKRALASEKMTELEQLLVQDQERARKTDTMKEEIGRLHQELERQIAKCKAAELRANEVPLVVMKLTFTDQ